MRSKSLFVLMALALIVSFPAISSATNGMNLEGYGPISLGMGGAGLAFDNGTAAVMNNPATLGLMDDGHRFDVALGFLGPNVTAEMTGFPKADSSANAFFMPAFGWASKKNNLTYGIAMFAQGGMGTEYSDTSFLTAGSGEEVRSEVGVGRLMVPIAYNFSDKLTVGGSVDFVWAMMDLKMALSGAQLGDMVAALGGTQSAGTASGTMIDGMVTMITNGWLNPFWARFDFSDDSAFFGEAKGYGVAGKLGLVYEVSPEFTVGVTYHSKTALSDLETSGATVTINADMDDGIAAGGAPSGTFSNYTVPVTGTISVKDFQWPATYGIGVAYKAMESRLLLAADIKYIAWEEVMKDFSMGFEADTSQTNPQAMGFAGATMDASLFQEWDNQTVIAVGASYAVNDAFTVRAGYNHSANPIPNTYLNALFPAIVESHATLGGGYNFGSSSLNAALSMAFESSATNSMMPVESTHSQLSGQVMYSYKY
ncbi:MAG: outer membrane protein transport protein [Nitrospirota bacterium]|nr:MAG: outer membrane protein transport protein [Nitrospirota bacterium]